MALKSKRKLSANRSRQRLKKRKHPGRQELPAHLERVEQIIPCTSEQCVCGICGKEKQVIGYEASEVLDVEPAKYFVQVTKREKRACKGCEEGGVSCAPLPERIIEKGLGSDRVVIDAVINKYSFHLPLYRQSVVPAGPLKQSITVRFSFVVSNAIRRHWAYYLKCIKSISSSQGAGNSQEHLGANRLICSWHMVAFKMGRRARREEGAHIWNLDT